MRKGERLSVITAHLCRTLDVKSDVLPMTDASVRTIVHRGRSEDARLPGILRPIACPRPVSALSFDGAEGARPAEEIAPALANADLVGIIMCPSNPGPQYLSFWSSPCPVCGRPRSTAAVPIYCRFTDRRRRELSTDPAAKIMQELGVEPSVVSIARHYRFSATGLVIDHVDADYAPAVEGGRNACVRHAVSDAVGGGPPRSSHKRPSVRS